jgi:uncharacterized membrane protein
MEILNDQDRRLYWDGWANKAIRFWFYVGRGTDEINKFKYIIGGVVAIYFAAKLQNLSFLVIIFITTIPILGVFGWYTVHHMAKRMEFLNIEFSTHFGKYSINMQEETLKTIKANNEILTEIKKLLAEIKEK